MTCFIYKTNSLLSKQIKTFIYAGEILASWGIKIIIMIKKTKPNKQNHKRKIKNPTNTSNPICLGFVRKP